jgi:hypothetical protein
MFITALCQHADRPEMALGLTPKIQNSLVCSDEKQLRPLKHKPSREISILQIVIWLQFANIVAFGVLFALWHHTDQIWGYRLVPLKRTNGMVAH